MGSGTGTGGADELRELAEVSGMRLSEDELAALRPGVAHLSEAARRLRELDLRGRREVPGTRFDPRWR